MIKEGVQQPKFEFDFRVTVSFLALVVLHFVFTTRNVEMTEWQYG